MKPEVQAYIRHRLSRAEEALDEAKLLVEAGHLLTAVNRLYYACFYCVAALLLTEGRRASKHSGVRALFDRFWVKAGRVSVERGRFYRRMFDHRQKADYADFVRFEPGEVAGWAEEAAAFVDEISGLVERLLRGECDDT